MDFTSVKKTNYKGFYKKSVLVIFIKYREVLDGFSIKLQVVFHKRILATKK